ncbi:MAG: hypothetical protein IT290_13300 [Deltaproteobacteria bacterium]|nr:hypothetical protein [Deltaproteobacteria bacterium]
MSRPISFLSTTLQGILQGLAIGPTEDVKSYLHRPVPGTIFLSLLFSVGAFVPFGDGNPSGIERELFNALHFPAFFYITLTLYQLWHSSFSATRRAIVTISAVLLGVVGITELIQPLFGRDGAIDDTAAGALGVVAATVTLLVRSSAPHLSAILLYSLALLGTATFASPLYTEYVAIKHQRGNFPDLAAFHDSLMYRHWHPVRPSEVERVVLSRTAIQSEPGLLVQVHGSENAGVRYDTNYQDWSSYDHLELTIVNPGEPFHLALRIDDDGDCSEPERRFEKTFDIASGMNTFSVPSSEIAKGGVVRGLKVSRVKRLFLLIPDSSMNRAFTVSRVALR